MARTKRTRGRPPAPLPPRIDATPEQIANVVLNAGRPTSAIRERIYACSDCGNRVSYPDTLCSDGRCEKCNRKAR